MTDSLLLFLAVGLIALGLALGGMAARVCFIIAAAVAALGVLRGVL